MQNYDFRIGLATDVNINRRNAWSGTTKHMLSAIKSAGGDIIEIPPVWESPSLLLAQSGRIINKLTGFDPMLNRSRTLAKLKANSLMRQISSGAIDLIFAPVGSTVISDLPLGVPVAYCSDATLELLDRYYDRFNAVPGWLRERAIRQEAAALQRADILFFPTSWAASSAQRHYGIPERKIRVIEFGANITDPPSRLEAMDTRKPGPLRLLFCGVEWNRKGGDKALEALKVLGNRGVESVLTIVGCQPPPEASANLTKKGILKVFPFIDKSTAEGRALFRSIFLDADFLILPTKAECFGLVICEAAACGTVPIASQTGGIPEVIQDKKTGRVLPLMSSGTDYAEAILEIIQHPGRLEKMRASARADYEDRLNWGTWSKNFLREVENFMSQRHA